MSSSSSSEEEEETKIKAKYTCPFQDCDKVFSRPSRLKTHEYSHTGEKPFKCHCGKAYARRFHLQRHVQNHHENSPKIHPGKNIKCTDCDANFSNKYSFNKHWKDCHDPENKDKKQYTCPECRANFPLRKTLKKHRIEEHGLSEKPIICPKCDKTFVYPKQLKAHQKTAHDGRRYLFYAILSQIPYFFSNSFCF